MKTEKPITSISYNTVEYLDTKCQELVANQIIDFYAFIKHKGEIDPFDGTRDKDHIHIMIRPIRALDTATILKHFYEFDPEHESMPLGCVRFEKCKNLGTWVLYSLHYAPYLDSIGETKEFYDYPFDSFHTNNEQELKRMRRSYQIEYKPKHNTIKTMLEQGIPRAQILSNVNPTAIQYKAINDMILDTCSRDPERFTIIDNTTGQKL